MPNVEGKEYQEGFLESMFRKVIAPWILHKYVKMLIFLGFSVMLCVSLLFLDHVELGLDQRIALPRDSYLVGYFDDLEAYFKVGPPVYFVVQETDPTTFQGQADLCSRAQGCTTWSVTNILEQERKRSNVSYLAQPTASWIDDMFMWLNPTTDCCRFRKVYATNQESSRRTSPLDAPRDDREMCNADDWPEDCEHCITDAEYQNNLGVLPKGSDFMYYLHYFLKAVPSMECPLGGSAAYGSAIVQGEGNQSITATHFRTYHNVLKKQGDFIRAYESALRISKEMEDRSEGRISVFPYSIFYIFFEQYLFLVDYTLIILGMALLAIFVTTGVFLGSPQLGAILIVTVLSILVNMVGLVMYRWDISLNAITVVNLLICVGISVEFCSHIVRAYSITAPEEYDRLVQQHGQRPGSTLLGSRNRRVFVSLVEVGSSVFSGITLTKFCGILVLAFAQSKIFEVYYFRMYLGMVLLGASHGLVLLPVLLSWFGTLDVIHPGYNHPGDAAMIPEGTTTTATTTAGGDGIPSREPLHAFRSVSTYTEREGGD